MAPLIQVSLNYANNFLSAIHAFPPVQFAVLSWIIIMNQEAWILKLSFWAFTKLYGTLSWDYGIKLEPHYSKPLKFGRLI